MQEMIVTRDGCPAILLPLWFNSFPKIPTFPFMLAYPAAQYRHYPINYLSCSFFTRDAREHGLLWPLPPFPFPFRALV